MNNKAYLTKFAQEFRSATSVGKRKKEHDSRTELCEHWGAQQLTMIKIPRVSYAKKTLRPV